MTGEQLKANLSQVHRDTVERWGVSYDRLSELKDMMDNEHFKFRKKKYTLTQAIIHLREKYGVDKCEAIVIVQLYEVLKKKDNILLN